ncbi:MAG: hypothetical protein Ct9H300mP21_01880 [Pseudomonadota bacterium]|nr:MAG: hypothetical protein Ct9H300mP21_01880 [Pseudomonadota bacterium]
MGCLEIFPGVKLVLPAQGATQTQDSIKIWVQALSTSDSSWVLGMGYSGNKLTRNRIEGEIREVFGNTLKIQPDGKTYTGQISPPGEQRFTDFYR